MPETQIDPTVHSQERPRGRERQETNNECRPGLLAAAGPCVVPEAADELDTVLQLLVEHDCFAGMDRLVKYLREVRLATSDDEWHEFVTSQVLPHPIRETLHRDPFTRRSFEKPRGFPGDAVLLDFIYGRTDTAQPPDADTEPLAHGIYSYTVNAPAPRAVRYRRSLIARLVDQTAESFRDPRILSLACGHLREAELSGALQNESVSEWCGVDQDRECIGHLAKSFASCPCVRPVVASIREIISGKRTFTGYHFVYAAGLFDYLQDAPARALVERMFNAAVPGGSVLVTNFLPGVHDVGYMESVMDWHLVCRTESEVLGLFSSIPRAQLRQVAISVDPAENIVFAIAEKR